VLLGLQPLTSTAYSCVNSVQPLAGNGLPNFVMRVLHPGYAGYETVYSFILLLKPSLVLNYSYQVRGDRSHANSYSFR
jgi:hypothetical protein